MSIITLTTVGLGDYVPLTKAGRWVAVIWMILGTSITAAWFGSLSSFFFEGQAVVKQAEVSSIAEPLFHAMDADEDGYLQKAEHHLYRLMMDGVVGPETLKRLEEDFATLSAGQSGVSYNQLQSNSIVTRENK